MSDLRFPSRNVAYSGARLIANQILPLLALPFVLARVGPAPFGTMVFTQAVAWYFLTLVEYGFNLTGVKKISINRLDHMRVRATLYDVLSAKLLLASLALVACVVTSLTIFRGDADTIFSLALAMILPIGAAFQPIWFFQGLEEFELISVVQVLSRLLCFAGVFVLVREPADAHLAQLLMALPYCLNAAVLLPVAIRRFGGPTRQPARTWISSIRTQLRDGLDVFVGQLATTLFSSTTTVLAGVVLGTTYSGYYGVAEKMIRGVAMLTTPVTDAVYPRLAIVFQSKHGATRAQAFRLVKRILIVMIVALALAGTIIITGSSWFARLISSGGAGAVEIQTTLCLLAFVPLFIFVNNIFGVQLLVGMGFTRAYRNAMVFSGLTIPVMCLTLPYFLGFSGFPVALLLGELLLAALTVVLAKRLVRWEGD